MEKIKRKKIVIASIYLTIFFLVIYSVYSVFRNKETCFDKIQNQNEEDVDCGGVCQKKCEKIEAQELVVGKTGIVPAGLSGKYDFYAEIYNPNFSFGSKNFEYEISLKNSSGEMVISKKGNNFILPGEKKYLVETNLESQNAPISGEVKIISSEWVQFNQYYESPKLKVTNKVYNKLSDGINFSEAKGLLKNDSEFDFSTIKVQIILLGENEKVLALSSTRMNTVKSGEERDFRVFWPSQFPGEVLGVEARPEVDIFSQDVFLKRFYKSENFQKY